MTSKERVLAAIAHQEPDRVPVDYVANPEIHEGLKAYYGLAQDDQEGLLQALGVDLRHVAVPYVGPMLHDEIPGISVDMWGVHRRWIEHDTGGYWDYCDWPLRNATPEQVGAWPMPSPDDFDYARVPALCDRYAGYCVVLGSAGLGDIINSLGMLRTMEQVLVDLITDDPAGLALIDRKIGVQVEMTARTLEAAQGKVDLLCIGEDLGTQRGPTISLDLFRKHIRPRLQQIVDVGLQWDIPVMIHSCGSSSWAFDDFVEMGIRVVDTLQPEAVDMEPAYLKDRYGDVLAFHGMISTAGPVAYGTVADVEENVRETLETMMPGGGYVLSPTHALQSNSPIENVVAVYEAARSYGMY
jgi:hypothetical protein